MSDAGRPPKKRGQIVICGSCWVARWYWAVPEAVRTLRCDRCDCETLHYTPHALDTLRRAFGKDGRPIGQERLPGMPPEVKHRQR